MPLILGTNSIKDSTFSVDNSCMFNSASSDRLNRTLGTPTNNYKWTYSFWLKRGILGSEDAITGAISDSQNKSIILFRTDDQLEIMDLQSDSYVMQKKTNRKFRDVSSWYHIVISSDATLSSPATKIYVNGVEETDFATSNEYSQNQANLWNSAIANHIGASDSSSRFWDGYLAEFVFIDGQVLDPTSFGEFDDSGIWKPKDVSALTFGNNGFYLDFEDSSNLGNDANGGTDWTASNLTAESQMTDTCTNNFATLNPNVVIGSTSRTFEEGNLSFKAESNNWTNTYSTLAVSQGKWYAEMKIQKLQSSNGYGGVGILGTNHGNISSAFNTDSNSAGLELDHRGGSNVNIMSAGSNQGDAGEDFEQGKIVGLAVDMDNRALYISENGTYLTVGGSVGDPTSGSSKTGAITIPTGIDFFGFAVGGYSTDFKAIYNFGSPAYSITSGNSDANGHGNFEYSVPSNYFTLCTKNIAEFG